MSFLPEQQLPVPTLPLLLPVPLHRRSCEPPDVHHTPAFTRILSSTDRKTLVQRTAMGFCEILVRIHERATGLAHAPCRRTDAASLCLSTLPHCHSADRAIPPSNTTSSQSFCLLLPFSLGAADGESEFWQCALIRKDADSAGLPPLAQHSCAIFINIILTLCGWIPGVIHALL